MKVKQIFDNSDSEYNKKIVELVDKIDKVCHKYDVNTVKDALLTMLTWFIADCVNKSDQENYINTIAISLKESVKMQSLASAETSDIPS